MGKSNRIVCVGGNLASVALDTDDTMAGDSDAAVPTQKAVKAYVNSQNQDASATVLVGAGLTYGSILIGDDGGEGAELDISGDGQIIVGNGDTATSVALSGDVTMDNTGAVTIADGAVTTAMLGADVGLVIAASGGDTMSREENVAGLSSAITLANELRTDIIAHFANATRHTTGQQSTATIEAAATDLETLLALAGSELTLFAAHNTDAILASGWAYHTAQAADKVLTSAVTPVTLVEAVTRLNDLKAKYNDHEDETTGHGDVGTVAADQTAASDAAYGAANLVPIAGVASGDIVFWSILDDGTGNVTGVSAVAATDGVTFTFSADPQSDAVISYMVVRAAA